MIEIRKYTYGEEEYLWKIFYDTVRNVNVKDYTIEQVKAWAPEVYDKEDWNNKIMNISPYVAFLDGKILGYADLQDNGKIDHFYVHHNFQRMGIGNCLMNHLIKQARTKRIKKLYSEVSITAKPFFEYFKFRVAIKQEVEIRGIKIINYLMDNNLV